jgi:hypothetical protein
VYRVTALCLGILFVGFLVACGGGGSVSAPSDRNGDASRTVKRLGEEARFGDVGVRWNGLRSTTFFALQLGGKGLLAPNRSWLPTFD